MKKFVIIAMMLGTCNYLGEAQKQKRTSQLSETEQMMKQVREDDRELFAQLEKSKATSFKILTDIKKLANHRIVYRTKVIENFDTTWVPSPCQTVITPMDSSRIAVMFKQDTLRSKTEKRIIFKYSNPKK